MMWSHMSGTITLSQWSSLVRWGFSEEFRKAWCFRLELDSAWTWSIWSSFRAWVSTEFFKKITRLARLTFLYFFASCCKQSNVNNSIAVVPNKLLSTVVPDTRHRYLSPKKHALLKTWYQYPIQIPTPARYSDFHKNIQRNPNTQKFTISEVIPNLLPTLIVLSQF